MRSLLSSSGRRGAAAAAAAASSRFASRSAASPSAERASLAATDNFAPRHIGPRDADIAAMLRALPGKYASLDALSDATVPDAIKLKAPLDVCEPLSETEALAALRAMAGANIVAKSFYGCGYHGTHTPGVILRNILENPGWYTSYTPYQAEISQGRLESLLNFQTLICELTGMDMSNASLLDESTAAAEAMQMTLASVIGATARNVFFVADDVHPQTLAVVRTRAAGLGVDVVVRPASSLAAEAAGGKLAGALLQYPGTAGALPGPWLAPALAAARAAGTLTIAATDPLAAVLLAPPASLGFDIAVGSAQRFGVPMGFGGPHAGFLACKDALKRRMPGRIMGVSVDASGGRALRMALQTREQHIRRDKATSNICTAQALLANMAAMYAVYHGPAGLTAIARRVRAMAVAFASEAARAGWAVEGAPADRFDTVTLAAPDAARLREAAEAAKILLRFHDAPAAAAAAGGAAGRVSVSFDETVSARDLRALAAVFGLPPAVDWEAAVAGAAPLPAGAGRDAKALLARHAVFNSHHSETQLLRYIHRLQAKDLSLTYSMISLGSCTMKLNATSQLAPLSWPELANMHPFAPAEHTAGYRRLASTLSTALAKITGFAAVSLQPNSGAAGEYAGLMAIRAYHESRGQGARDVCLIPMSAHGTNPASAVMAGYKVVVVSSDDKGNVDAADFAAKLAAHGPKLAALMITYPSTYGVFEAGAPALIQATHAAGGQVYMDGANMNAQVGLTSPGHIGADVCHLNLHKTFAIPHGGGGPGVGAIGVAAHLAPFLPGHPVVATGGDGAGVVPKAALAVAGAPYGSALILPISWMYIHMLGSAGLKRSTQVAILNANYLAARLAPHYPIAFTAANGTVAHEFIIDLRPFKAKSGGAIGEEDVAKRLIDYGFHSPTMSWPVAGTLMIEPTESEDRAELDRFADALIAIKGEIDAVLDGRADAKNNVLKRAPHTAAAVADDAWDRPYTRAQAAYPAPWSRGNKFWPSVGRVDNVHGDRVLICACEPTDSYAEPAAAAAAPKKAMK